MARGRPTALARKARIAGCLTAGSQQGSLKSSVACLAFLKTTPFAIESAWLFGGRVKERGGIMFVNSTTGKAAMAAFACAALAVVAMPLEATAAQ